MVCITRDDNIDRKEARATVIGVQDACKMDKLNINMEHL